MADRFIQVWKKPVPFVALFFLALAGLVIPAAAVDFSTSQYNGNIQAGGTISYAVLAGVPWDGEPVDLLVDVMGINQRSDLQFVAVEPVKDTYAYSARKYTLVSSPEIHVDKGNKKQIILTLQVPADAGSGGRYAMVVVHTLPGKNVTAADYNIPVFLTLLGTSQTVSGSITSLDAGTASAGQPVIINTGYKNTGNIHQINVANTITISGADGNAIFTNTTTLDTALLPDKSYTFILQPDTRNLPAGTYTVASRVTANGKELMDRKTTTLVISGSGQNVTTTSTLTAASTPAPAPTKSSLPPLSGIAAILGAVALVSVWKKQR
jgi:hypothetical protein